MLELEIGGHRAAVPIGELVIGTDASCALRLGGEGLKPLHAIVVGAADGSASVRRGEPDAEVAVNGVKLGGEPAPILHGDKLQVGPHELLVTDPRRGGSTQFVSAADVAKMVSVGARPGGPPKPPTAATGGRLVCLTDGREYMIGAGPTVVGREAGCDIVVPNKDVSRRHAEILATPQGYVLIDSSTNGSFVNGDRIEGQRLLARADVIRIGDHEFRFYADKVAEAPPAAPPPLATAPPEPAAPAPPAPPPPEGAAARLSSTMMGVPVTPPAPRPTVPSAPGPRPSVVDAPPAPPPPAAAKPEPRAPGVAAMATLLVRSGQLKGTRFPIKVPVVNIGRADFNDIVIPDESVSGMHAKLQRREGVWILTDNDSTNGTFVDGEKVQGDAAVSPGAVVRFGEISAMFEPTDDEMGVGKGTGTKVVGAIRPDQLSKPPAAPAPAPPAPAAPTPAAPAPAPPPPAVASPGQPPAMMPPPRQARPPVVVSSPPRSGLPGWVIPVVVVVIVAVVALVLLSR
jgi:pSer/pThr/pTyr-binding forkhead associated (FHA) protein